GTSLNTTPFPIPAVKAINNTPTVYKPSAGENARIIEAIVKPLNTHNNTNKGWNLSAKEPPIGRTKYAKTIKPAVLIPASTLSKAKESTKKLGKNTVKATNDPNVIK